jgi:tetratricopeptide (TPR) repeat protein
MNNPTITKSQRVRFEEVTPTNEIVAYFNAQLPDLLAGTGLPIFPGYDDLDSIQFAYITLPSGNTLVLGQYGNAPEIGVDLYVEFDPKNNSTAISTNIADLVVETLRYLTISRDTAVWFHPDYETEIELLYAKDVEFESIPKIPTEELALSTEYEPIDCFYYALEIYTREKLPEHWAMLQHNLGLAYFDRIKGERWENLQKSIECYHKSLEVFMQDNFPAKWQINQEDLSQSMEALKLEKQKLVKDTTEGAAIILSATEEYILSVICGHYQGVYGLDILNQENLETLFLRRYQKMNSINALPIGFNNLTQPADISNIVLH